MASSLEALQPEGRVEFAWMPAQLAAKAKGEDWTGVTGTAERRRLQNRLNQRAYRTRRKDGPLRAGARVAKDDDESTTNSHAVVQPPPQRATVSVGRPVAQRLQHRSRNGLPFTPAEMRQFERLVHLNYTHGVLDLQQLPRLTLHNFFLACKHNAEALGLAELWLEYDAVSPFGRPGPSLPPKKIASSSPSLSSSSSSSPPPPPLSCYPQSLRPTAVQQLVPHHPWLDLIPVPRLRDNMLRAMAGVSPQCDEDDLCAALFESGGVLVWGDAWDPRSWEIGSGYWDEHGWLLEGCAGLLASTNYWRAKRGERRLPVRAGWVAAGGAKEGAREQRTDR